jgi:autotransporter-associated beta strand protein
LAKRASLYNGATESWTAANIKVPGNATLALNVGGTGEFTTGDVTTLMTNLSGANGSSTAGFAAGSKIVFDTTNASGGTFTVADSIADSTGTGGGAIDVTKLGGNTLALSGLSATAANNYSGTTTIGAGTLAISANDPSFTGGLTFGSANASTTVGTLDLSTSSATYAGAALVRTNNATANTVLIGDGKTLTLNGGLTMGYDAAGGTGATQSNLIASGAGSLVITGTTIAVSVNQAVNNQAYWSEPTLDVSGLGAFSTDVTNFNIGVGNNSQGPGHVLLSNTANSIIATTLTVGNTGTNNGRGTSELILGTGTNVIQADTINIGRNKNSGPGVVKFASQTAGSPGTVTITDKAGTGRANIDIANQLANTTAGGAVGTLDLRGHVATVSAGTVTVGAVAATSGAGGPNGTLSFDAGAFDVNTLNLAPKSGAGTGTARATVNIGGGTFTVNTAFTLGSQTGSGASVATLNLTGGTLNSAVSILDGGGSTTSKITLDGGTLNMNGNAIGGAVAIDTLEFQSGTLQNVAQINNGATGLTKSTTGTLVLSGTNSYSGGTTVNGGTLLLSGAFNMPTTGTLQVNAGGNFSLADGTARTTTTAALGLASGALLSFDWNAGSVDMLTSTAAATTAGTVGIIINNTGPTGSGGTLISSSLGGLTTAGGTQYFLVNNTDYTATLAVTDTDVSIGAQSPATALTDAYWKGGQLTGALGAMALSNGASNWASDAAGTSANGVVPGGSAVNVIFGAAGATEQANVTTGADMNLGSITFNDSTAVTIGGSHVITLNSTSATAATSSGSGTTVTPGSAITVTSSANAANTINANIRLAANQTWNIAGGKTLTVGGSVGGTGALTLADAGTLILTGANAYTGATAVSAGTLQLGDGTTGKDGTIGNTSGVTNNAALVFNRFGSSSAGYAISGTGTVTKLGAGAQALSGTNTYTGATTISAGTLQFAKEVSLYNNNTAGTGWTAANIVVGNGGTLALNVGGTGEFTTGDVTTLLTNLGGANGTGAAGFAAGSKIAFDTTGGAFTVADLIADSTGGGGGAIGLTKLGANALTLTNANTYSGVTTISAGTLALGLNADNVTLGTLGTAAAGTVVQSGAALKLSGGNYTLNEAMTLSGSGVGAAANTFGALLLNYNTGSFIFNGAITLDGGAAINTYLAGTANVQIAQGIGGAGDLTLRASAANNGGALYRLQGQSTYDGNTILSTNATNATGITVQNEIDNALPTTTVLKLQATSGSPSTQGKYKLNGYNQTVAGIEGSVGATILNSIVGGSATLSTLTVNNSGNYTFDGQLGNTGTNENNLALVKSGVGTLTLTAANTYTGDTKVEAGTLSITNAYLADLADVYLTTNARFDLNFTGTDTIDELFFNGAGQLSGTWGSQTSTAVHKSGFFTGDGLLLVTTSGVLPGDTNEDRVVDAFDFITLKKNFGTSTGSGTAAGDFNSSGTVNWADLNILTSNMGTGGGGAPAMTPEPCSALLLVFGAAAVIRRRRKA